MNQVGTCDEFKNKTMSQAFMYNDFSWSYVDEKVYEKVWVDKKRKEVVEGMIGGEGVVVGGEVYVMCLRIRLCHITFACLLNVLPKILAFQET